MSGEHEARLGLLKDLLGEEAFGSLLAAAKLTEKDPLAVVVTAVKEYEFLAGKERHGWAVQLVRANDVRGYSLG